MLLSSSAKSPKQSGMKDWSYLEEQQHPQQVVVMKMDGWTAGLKAQEGSF